MESESRERFAGGSSRPSYRVPRRRSLVLGGFEERLQNRSIGDLERLPAARGSDARRLHEAVETMLDESLPIPPAERRHPLGSEAAAPEEIGCGADRGSGGQQRADTGLHVGADEGSDL